MATIPEMKITVRADYARSYRAWLWLMARLAKQQAEIVKLRAKNWALSHADDEEYLEDCE